MLLSSKAHQWGGAAFMLGNFLFLINKLNDMSRLFLSRGMPDLISEQDRFLVLIGQIALIIGYVAYYQAYAPRVERSGKNGLRLFCGGGILLAVSHVGFMDLRLPTGDFDLFIFVIIGLTVLLIGLIWFGITNLRRPVLAYWQWLPLATGLLGFIAFYIFSGETPTAIFLLFRSLFALGLIGLGLILWLEKPVQLEAAQAHP